MAKFLYKMQNVLDVKLKLEDQAKSAYAEAMMKLNEEEAKLQALFLRKEQYEEEGRRMREDSINVNDLRENTHAIENLKEQIVLQEEEVRVAEEGVEVANRLLTKAMQERKTQEKLKENAFEEFKRELNVAESKEIDELVSYRYGQGKQ